MTAAGNGAGEQRCPRCGGSFACGFDGPAPCACTALKLDRATLVDLRQRFAGCLCLHCLRAVAGAAPLEPAQPPATRP